MEKKESQDKLFSEIKPPSGGKLKEFLLTFLKFVIAVCLLPITYAVSVSFRQELLKLSLEVISPFIWGIVSFLGFYLFIWEPAILFNKGQRILEVIFRFFAPLVKVAPFVLPIYTIIIFIVYFILIPFVDMQKFEPAFLFAIGFSLSFHLVFAAKTLSSKQKDFLKVSYIFGFSWVYILDSLLLAFFFNLAFENFSFLAFFNNSYEITKNIYLAAFSQLFL